MNDTTISQRPDSLPKIDIRYQLIAALILLFAVGFSAWSYLSNSMNATGTNYPIMPLDDAYIHFQYARAIADGHAFHYNADQPPTSGATSLIYPFLLAMGYELGFTAERLAWWAVGIGVLTWFGSAVLVYRTAARENNRLSQVLGILAALTFALTGSLAFAFVSGMETGLMIFFTLSTLFYAMKPDRRAALICATITALIRPEGVAIALLTSLYLASFEPTRRDLIRHLPIYVLPVLAGFIQPALNLIITGSLTATGMQSKSYFYNVPFDLGNTLLKMLDHTAQTWIDFMTGEFLTLKKANQGATFFLFGTVMAMIASFRFIRTRRFTPTLLVFAWMLAMTAASVILETVFWQFKRYQQPILVLSFPLGTWAFYAVFSSMDIPKNLNGGRAWGSIIALMLLNVGVALFGSNPMFNQFYSENAREVAISQIQMARYAAENIPPDAVIGVHDIGVMRYLGNHPTYDIVGLTTPGAAKAWRNGPGSTYEAMKNSPWRPDYFAIYNDARSLTYFVDTGLFGEKIASFPSAVQGWYNVASATTNGQYIYKADWSHGDYADGIFQPSSIDAIGQLTPIDSINVAELASEEAHHYKWWEAAKRPGFASEVYQMNYINCAADHCTILDGGRLITGGEEMTIKTTPGEDLMMITRVHPRNRVTLNYLVNGQKAATRIIFPQPGQWLEISILFPGEMITGISTVIRIEANITDPNIGHYMPYYHLFYTGKYVPNNEKTLSGATATFGESLQLLGHSLNYDPASRLLTLDLEWQKAPDKDLIDAKLFMHLYDQDGKLVEIAQIDQRPGNGVLPLANWLPGILRDSYTLQIPSEVAAGMYRVAIGLYDPNDALNRLPVTGTGSDQDRRLFLGDMKIE